MSAAIWNELVSVLSGIDGTGSYNYDVSGDGQVVEGDLLDPHRFPCLFVLCRAIEVTPSPELGNFRHRMSATVVGWAEYTADDNNSRLTRCFNLADDVRRALRVARSSTLGTLVNDITSGSITGPINGAQLDSSFNCAAFVMDVTLEWFEDGTP